MCWRARAVLDREIGGPGQAMFDHGEGNGARDWARVGLWLVGATMAYNVIEAGIALWSGAEAGSIALVGFGLDSLIEQTTDPQGSERLEVPCASIRPNPFQPREIVDEDGIRELAPSIERHGVLQAPVVRPADARARRGHASRRGDHLHPRLSPGTSLL